MVLCRRWEAAQRQMKVVNLAVEDLAVVAVAHVEVEDVMVATVELV